MDLIKVQILFYTLNISDVNYPSYLVGIFLQFLIHHLNIDKT